MSVPLPHAPPAPTAGPPQPVDRIAPARYLCRHVADFSGPLRIERCLGGLGLAAPGRPSDSAYIAACVRRTDGPAAGDWTVYRAYSLFRITALVRGIAKPVQDGTASDPQAADRGRKARALAELGRDFAQRVPRPC